LQFSDNIVQNMGFDLSEDGETIDGRFYRLEVFEILGAKIQESSLQKETILISQSSAPVSVSLGSSLNAVCHTVSGEEYVENESQWRKEKSCSGSIMIIAIGPTDFYSREVRFRKYENGQILTFDAFHDAKNELQQMSDSIIPQIVSAFSSALWTDDTSVRLLRKDICIYGRTADNLTIQDMRITMNANLSITRVVNAERAASELRRSLQTASKVDAKFAEFMHLGLIESNATLKFLSLFLFVERAIHKTFGLVNHRKALAELASGSQISPKSLEKLLGAHRATWSGLLERFTWCAITRWRNLDDADIEEFAQLKKLRDKFSHGELRSIDDGNANRMETFAKKVFRVSQSTVEI
jgi:hypothetical protein